MHKMSIALSPGIQMNEQLHYSPLSTLGLYGGRGEDKNRSKNNKKTNEKQINKINPFWPYPPPLLDKNRELTQYGKGREGGREGSTFGAGHVFFDSDPDHGAFKPTAPAPGS